VTFAEAVAETERTLAVAGVPTPRVDAEWLVAHVAGVSRSRLALGGEVDGERLRALAARRAGREPLAYVLGEWGFRRLTLTTDARALVPRPETEVVVDRCLALLEGMAEPRVLDVGTGSGAIALALADELSGARVVGVDLSEDALSLARENAERLALPVELRLAGAEAAAEGWELVVSNPPYVTAGELETLEPEVRDWEPRAALLDTGLAAELATAARTQFLVLEVGDRRAAEVAADLAGAGYADVRITRDLTGEQRVVEGRRQ
jgi:release factor glutamine methyltransferase